MPLGLDGALPQCHVCGMPAHSLEAALGAAKRSALLEYALSNPATTLGELVKLGDGLGKIAETLTVRDITNATKKNGVRTVSVGNVQEVDTRTAAGRQAYEDSVFTALKASGGGVSAKEIRREVGGTPDQARRALNRLIEADKIKYTGQAAGTKYTAR